MADLSTIKLFKGLPEKELKQIAGSFKTIPQAAGREIMVAGHHGVGFMVILEGEAEVESPAGAVSRLGPGDHFGEMALLDEKGRSATVRAVTDMTVLVVPEWGFKSFLAEHPEIAWRLLQTLSRRFRELQAAG